MQTDAGCHLITVATNRIARDEAPDGSGLDRVQPLERESLIISSAAFGKQSLACESQQVIARGRRVRVSALVDLSTSVGR